MHRADVPAQNVVESHLLLVGAMGVGKTTVGRELAARLGRPFLDSDIELERSCGDTGAQIASRDGVARLHTLELELFSDMVETVTPSVIAPAASVVDSATGRALLDGNVTIWLDAPEDVLAARRGTGDHRRDVNDDEVIALERGRRPFWQELATVRIDTSRSVADTLEALVSEVRRVEAG